MPEHQQIQQSKKKNTIFQKQTTPVVQMPVSNPYSIIQRAKINPKSLSHADVMQLQRTIGNRAVAQLLSGIVNSSSVQQATVQRQEITEEEEPLQGKFESIQRQEIPEEEEPLQGKMIRSVQRQEIPEEKPLQAKRKNNTGIPDNLKAGVENLSGTDMSDVRVHYNSSKPAEVGALAYTQGTNIHVAPRQEKYLPHESWHVVQRAQGRVQPTFQMKDMAVNDDVGLESEADVMGEKASQMVYNSQYIESEDESPKIMEKENKRVPGQEMRDGTLIQYKILWYRVHQELIEGSHHEEIGTPYDLQYLRDDAETKMLIEELRLRYPTGIEQNILKSLKNKLPSEGRVTYVDIREAIRQMEIELGLPQIKNAGPASKNGTELFVKDLMEHRGYYTWQGGTHDVFINGLNSESPGESELGKESIINCWEAVLFSAARTGLVSVDELKKSYSVPKDKQDLAVFEMIKEASNGVTEFKYPSIDNRTNKIKAGDIILIEFDEGPLSHVVAAIEENPKDYFEVKVMSLWNRLTGGSFNQVTLGEILTKKGERAIIRYSTLSRSGVENAIAQTSSTPLTRQKPLFSSIPSTSQSYVESTTTQSTIPTSSAAEMPLPPILPAVPRKRKNCCTIL